MVDIETIKQNYFIAVDFVENEIKEMVEEYGDKGLELNTHPEEDCYSVTEEIEPNVFKVVKKVRTHYDELEVMLEGEDEWTAIMGITDWIFFLEEVANSIDELYD